MGNGGFWMARGWEGALGVHRLGPSQTQVGLPGTGLGEAVVVPLGAC